MWMFHNLPDHSFNVVHISGYKQCYDEYIYAYIHAWICEYLPKKYLKLDLLKKHGEKP